MQPKNLLLITYTLYPPENDYEKLVAKLEKADSYELDESAWLVCTQESAAYWFRQLEQFLYEDDELTVLRIDVHDVATDEALKEDLERWLKARFPKSTP
jgi:hypothetical protein